MHSIKMILYMVFVHPIYVLLFKFRYYEWKLNVRYNVRIIGEKKMIILWQNSFLFFHYILVLHCKTNTKWIYFVEKQKKRKNYLGYPIGNMCTFKNQYLTWNLFELVEMVRLQNIERDRKIMTIYVNYMILMNSSVEW